MKVEWNLAASVKVRDTVARSMSGHVTDEDFDGTNPTGGYTYDAAGRLTAAAVPGKAYVYGFAGSGGCGVLTNAGLDTNRTSMTVNGGTATTYCYDRADRLTSTSTVGYTTAIAYDAHGNTTTIAGETRAYDAADRHRSSTKGATTVTYVRDATDRLVSRSDGTTTTKFAYSATGDTGDATLDNAGNVIERTLVLPGGVLLTKRTGGDVWSYPNLHGDVITVANSAGVKQGSTMSWGPYGETLTALPDNLTGLIDWS